MARITVEDCITVVPNRFELIMLAAHRARQLAGGADPSVARDHDKNPVVALREIGAGAVTPESIMASVEAGIARKKLGGDESVFDAEFLAVEIGEFEGEEDEDGMGDDDDLIEAEALALEIDIQAA